MDRQNSAEDMLRSIDRTEGPNVKYVTGDLNFDEESRRRKLGWDARLLFGKEGTEFPRACR